MDKSHYAELLLLAPPTEQELYSITRLVEQSMLQRFFGMLAREIEEKKDQLVHASEHSEVIRLQGEIRGARAVLNRIAGI